MPDKSGGFTRKGLAPLVVAVYVIRGKIVAVERPKFIEEIVLRVDAHRCGTGREGDDLLFRHLGRVGKKRKFLSTSSSFLKKVTTISTILS